MSFVFDVDGTTVWNPALRVGEAFVGCAETLGRVTGVHPGFSFQSSDWIDIDAAQLEAFTQALTVIAEREPHPHRIFVTLTEPVRILCLVMLDRAGRPAAATLDADTLRLIQETSASMPQ